MSAYSDAVLSLVGPSLYWSLDTVTKLNDLSGNGRNGTGQGGVVVGGFAGSPIAGASPTATEFAEGKYANSTYASYINGTTRTFCGWFMRKGGKGESMFGSTTSPYTIVALDDVESYFLFSPNWGSTNTKWEGFWPGDEQWVFVAFVFNEATDEIELFVNGKSVGKKANTGSYGGTVFRLAGWDVGAAEITEWTGPIAHFFIAEKAIPESTFKTLYQLATAPPSIPYRRLRSNEVGSTGRTEGEE